MKVTRLKNEEGKMCIRRAISQIVEIVVCFDLISNIEQQVPKPHVYHVKKPSKEKK